MKRIKRITIACWMANVLDAEDAAIRTRKGLPLPATPPSYLRWHRDGQTDLERGITHYRQRLAHSARD